jgi:hypothetical protein
VNHRIVQSLAGIGVLALGLAAVLLGASLAGAGSGRSAPVTSLQGILDLLTAARPRSNGQTRLLITELGTEVGVESSIAIANTGRDPYGTTGTTGSCNAHFYGTIGGTEGAETTRTTPSIAPGTLFSWAVRQGTSDIASVPDFLGYVILTCDFPLAHAYHFTLSNVGIPVTQNALVLPSARDPAFVEALGH